MPRRIHVVFLVICVLCLTAGAFAARSRPGVHHPPSKQKAATLSDTLIIITKGVVG